MRNQTNGKAATRCAIYTRKSSEEGLEQDFNSLDAQRESCEAFILSQKHEGWIALPEMYDDGGVSGATMERPALKRLLSDIEAGRIDTVVVYKVDRLTRSLGDFAKIVEVFDTRGVSFVSVTQQFNTTTSMGRLTLRVRPETLCRITEFSEHESNGRELDEGERVAVEVLPVLGQSAAAVEPGDGAFDHPTPGLDDEALHPIGSLDDLGLEIGQDAGQGAVKDRALIGAVGEQFPEKGKQTEQGRQQRETAVAILNVGGGDDAVQQQALRIDQNMPLLALDQLAGIEAVAVDASPPFSALFTL